MVLYYFCLFASFLVFPQLLQAQSSPCAALSPRGHLQIRQEIYQDKDISAIGKFGKYLMIGSDEEAQLQILEPGDNKDTYVARQELIHLLESGIELDLEGIAIHENVIYAVGSHSLKRKKIKPDNSQKKNRKRIRNVEEEVSRNNLFKFEIDPETAVPRSEITKISLIKELRDDVILGRFANIPSKENGIDIEGIAADGNRLYLGFRGPVLRENHVPVMVFDFEKPEAYELRFINLGGQGIRDMCKVENGFLLIGGPVGDGRGGHHIYFWDGEDDIPGKDRGPSSVKCLGGIEGKAEGIALIEESENHYKVVVVYDGLEGGAPALFMLPK